MVSVLPYICFSSTLSFLKFISIADILVYFSVILILIFTGSYLTIKKRITFAFGKIYTILSLYSFIILGMIFSNAQTRLIVDHTFFSSCLNNNILSEKLIGILFFFSIIFLVILYSYVNNNHLIIPFEFVIVTLLAIFGMFLIFVSHDLFVWFFGIELQSFCFYALAAYRTNRTFLQSDAGLKYFFFGSIGSSLYLFSISLMYYITGSLNLDTITTILYFPLTNTQHQLFYISLVFIFIALFIKLGIAPFHFWVPQVYSNSSSIITLFFLLLPKIPLLYILYSLAHLKISIIFDIGIILSLAIGTLFAFHFTSFKTFMAYSAITNNAFFLVPALSVSFFSLNTLIFFIFTYNITIIIVFLGFLFLKRFDGVVVLNNLRDLIILKKANIFYAFLLSVALLGLAGIPPFIGFFGKFFILINAASFSSYFLITVILTFSLIVAYFYIRLIKIIFFSFDLKYVGITSMPVIPAYIIIILSFINIFSIFFPGFFILLLV